MSSLPSELHITRHAFEQQPSNPECRYCGLTFEIGLHFEDRGAFDYDLPDYDPVCRGCWHQRHEGACRIARSPVSSVPCGCKGAA